MKTSNLKTLTDWVPGQLKGLLKKSLLIPLVYWLFLMVFPACSESSDDPLPEYTLIIEPDGYEIPVGGVVKITAHISPVPDFPVTFEWGLSGNHGTISDDPPVWQHVDEGNTRGFSQVDYVAYQMGNEGGKDIITVTANHPNHFRLAEKTAEVEVTPPVAQVAGATIYEYTIEGTTPGRVTTGFIVAWIFDRVPGFTRYSFTVMEPAGEGWDVGPVGSTFSSSLSGALMDKEKFINSSYGADVLGLGDTKLAHISGGPAVVNYDPSDARWQERVEEQRNHRAQLAAAVYSVLPAH